MRSKTIGSATAGNNTGSATADYTSISSWAASIADTDNETGTVITKVAATDTSAFTINPANTGSYTYLLTADSTCAASDITNANASAQARVNTGTAATAVTINVKNFTWEKVSVLIGNNNNMTMMSIGDYDNVRVRRMMFLATNSNSANISGIAYSGTSGKTCIVSNVGFAALTSGSDAAMQCRTSGGILNVYHGSFLSASWYSTFFFDGGGVGNIYACTVQGTGGLDTGITAAGDILSQRASPPGTNSVGSITGLFKNTSFGSEDLNLYGLNGALLVGVTDRSGTEGDLSTDIKGNARPLASGFPIDPGAAMISAGPSVLTYADSGNLQTTEPCTLSLTVSGSNRKLLCMISSNGTINAVDWNGTTMTAVTGAAKSLSGVMSDIYELDNPATGAHTLTVDFASGSKFWIAAYVVAFANDSNNPVTDVGDGNTTNTGTTLSKSTTTANANEGAFDILSNSSSGAGPYPDSPQVFRAKSATASFHEASTSARLAVSAASNTDGWSFNSGYTLSLSVVYIKPGSGGGGGEVTTPIDNANFSRRGKGRTLPTPVTIGY